MEALLEVYNQIYSLKAPVDLSKLSGLCSRLSDHEIASALSVLDKNGLILRKKKESYAVNFESGKLFGMLEVKSKGYGFVILPERDCFVSKIDIGTAMHGDLVVVKVRARRKRARTPSLEGVIVKILKRANTKIIGRFEYDGRISVVTPSDRRISFVLEIPTKNRLGAREGQIVAAEIEKYPDEKGTLPIGRITEILGNEWDPLIEIEIILREHNLSAEFSDDVEAECRKLVEPSETDLTGRKDYRKTLTVTIDGIDAKDFDDAVSVVKTNDGYILSVMIADVTHYVVPGTFTFDEAEERATSVYLVDRVIPMLPKTLSNNLCSLVPNRDRLCLAAEMSISKQGKINSFEVHKGLMISDFRLTYESVDEFFETGRSNWPKEVEEMLLNLKELSLILEEKRLARGSIDFESVEAKVVLNDEGKAVDINLVSETASRKLIEESMLAANETIAGFLKKRKNGAIYRIHQEPDLEVISQLSATIEALGHPRLPEAPNPHDLQKVVKFAHNRPEKLLINTLLLRSMQQARYSTLETGHFGLASENYTHFTSPIRRFPDLMVHLLVKKEIDKSLTIKDGERLMQRLPMIAEHSSIKEREAQDAERESVDVKVCEYMTRHIGEEFDAIISGVTQFGIFVELENTAEGLIHISMLEGDYFTFNKDDLAIEGVKTGIKYKLGRQVRVRLKRVKIGQRQLDFELLADKASP